MFMLVCSTLSCYVINDKTFAAKLISCTFSFFLVKNKCSLLNFLLLCVCVCVFQIKDKICIDLLEKVGEVFFYEKKLKQEVKLKLSKKNFPQFS